MSSMEVAKVVIKRKLRKIFYTLAAKFIYFSLFKDNLKIVVELGYEKKKYLSGD